MEKTDIKFPKIHEKPGTCGGCAHFGRFHNGVAPMASGKCRIWPNRWIVWQSTKACKTYEGKEKDDE